MNDTGRNHSRHDMVDDEIDLFELFDGLIKEKLTILAVVLIAVVIAGLYAFLGPRTYEVNASFLPPFDKDVVTLNFPGVVELDAEDIYRHFSEAVSSPEMGALLYRQPEIKSLFDEQSIPSDIAATSLMKSISVHLPQDAKIKLLTGNPLLINLRVQRDSAEHALLLMNTLVGLAIERTKKELVENRLLTIDEKLEVNSKQYDLENQRISQDLAAEIEQLKEADAEQKATILKEMELLREKAKQQRQYRIDRLEAELALAEKLGIKRPIDPLEYKKEQRSETTIDISSRNPSGYWLGSEILTAEIRTLQSRKNDDPYIEDMAELQKQLRALDVNQRINTILARTDNLPFSEELRALKVEESQLLQAKERVQKARFEVARAVQEPVLPTKPIKPKKAVVLALGGASGLMLGVLVALTRRAYLGRNAADK